MKKIIAKVKAFFTKKPESTPEQTLYEEVCVPAEKPPVPVSTPKPKSNRKPGPKKQVPGQPAVKPAAPKKTGGNSKKPRQYNKPKPKV